MKRGFSFLFLSAVFLSGFCSLVYQLTWDRLARYNFGGDNISATIVLTTFLLGLGVGAYMFRKPFSRPLMAYGAVEISIGLFAILSVDVIANISLATAHLFAGQSGPMAGVRLATIVGCGAFLLPPCVLMGGTLPMMFSAFFSREHLRASRVGFLYGVNILGAMAGTVAVPFLLLNNFPIGTVLAGAGCTNILFGVVSMSLQYWTKRPLDATGTSNAVEARPGPASAGDAARGTRVFAIAFVTGAVTIIYEVMLIRHSYMMIPSSVYNISFVLLVVLLSLGSGSIVIPRLVGAFRSSVYAPVGVLLVLSACGLTGSLLASRYLIVHQALLPNLEKLGTTGIYYAVLAVPVFFPMGAVFPLLCAEGSSSGGALSRETGRLYLVNSLGALSGALFFHAVMSEHWGTRGSAVALVGLLAAAGVLSLSMSCRTRTLAPMALLGVGLAVGVYRADMQPFLLGPAATQYAHFTVVEGSSGVASVGWYDAVGNGGLVSINGQGMGAIPNEPYDMRILSAALAVSQPRRVLILGVATGSYVPPLLGRHETESLTLVDWSEEIGRLMRVDRIFVKGKNMGVLLDDPRLRFIVADARVAVAVFPDTNFDLVIDTLARPTWPGATGLRTPEYFRQIARILTDGGKLVLSTYYAGWKDAAWSKTAWRRETIASVRGAFEYVQENAEAGALIASTGRIRPPSEDRIEEIVRQYGSLARYDGPQLSRILSSGFSDLSPDEVRGAEPFSEQSVQSEYYYKMSDVLHFLLK